MDIPVTRWYPAIKLRHSQRQYDAARSVSSEILVSLQQTCQEFRPFDGARVALVTGAVDKVFKGILGPVLKVKGVSAYLAFIGLPGSAMAAGYIGEGLILEAVSLGLETCWISGTFRREIAESLVELKPGESVLAVSPLGYPLKTTESERLHKRKPLSQMVEGLPENDWPQWAGAALEAARLAPSAINRQPWKFNVEPDAVTVTAKGNVSGSSASPLLDCGIAMLHLELGARQNGVQGKWKTLSPPRVARYYV